MELTGHMRSRVLILIWSILVIFLVSCEEKEKANQKQETKPVRSKVQAPQFNADSAYSYVEQQVAFGPRVPNTEAHKECSEYLKSTLESFNWETQFQEFQASAFDGTVLNLRNIIASYNPNATKRILLAAHWDTRPFADQDEEDIKKPIDGANDGASGVGILMEIARVISLHKDSAAVGIDIILFDGEDYGQPDFAKASGRAEDSWCLGSQYWSRNMHESGYSAYYGILLDMVGAANAKFGKEGTSMHYGPSIVQKIWNTANSLGYGSYFINQNTAPIIDDHAYVNEIAGFPMVDIIEFDPVGDNYFGHYWHTHDDNMDVIDRATLKVVGQTVLTVVFSE